MVEVAILAVLQGVAEFLPISSSGHLVLGKSLLGLGDVGMRLDIFLHVGTLASVFAFYFSVIRRIVMRLEWEYMAKVVVSAVPVAIVGLGFKDSIEAFATPKMVGGALMFTGAVLTATRFLPKGGKDVSFLRAVLMGLAQAVAILPGVSRSGMTLAAARASKVDGEKAAEFSFLMSAPPIAGAALREIVKSMGEAAEAGAVAQASWGQCVFGAVVAAAVGWFALWLLVASLKGRWFWLFGPYCLLAGAIALAVH